MNLWMMILLPSALVGVCCAFLFQKKWAIFLAGLIPWLGFLAVLLYSVYIQSYDAMDASMWPIAQFFGGNAAAFAGVMGFVATRWFRGVKNRDKPAE
ncbi:MAG: hypothetical protein HOL48_04920 [Porticoccaceae bacterium]|jgi:hypothetical protein|nr:hypothetical protein [Porticoccaceae bacterium]